MATDTERRVNVACEQIVASGHVRLYRDLYKDLRERLSCGVACRLIETGLRHTRYAGGPDDSGPPPRVSASRAIAIAALKRLGRYAGWVEAIEDLSGRRYDVEAMR